jgi:hypothetical protein
MTHLAPLAQQQAALVAALTGQGPLPAGFDAARVRAAADALAFKRARAVAQAWPSVRAMLGADFRASFAAYATTAPLPQHGGPLADGRCFVRYVGARVPLTDAIKLQALSIDLRYRQTAAGLLSRRGPQVRVAWLSQARCVVVAIGERLFRLRLPRLRR